MDQSELDLVAPPPEMREVRPYRLRFRCVDGGTFDFTVGMSAVGIARILTAAGARDTTVIGEPTGRNLLVLWDRITAVDAMPLPEWPSTWPPAPLH